MFEITKSKGKPYKTDSPEKALEAYKLKHSITMYHGDSVTMTKTGVFKQTQKIWDRLENQTSLAYKKEHDYR